MVEGEFVGRPSFSVTQTTQEGPSGEKAAPTMSSEEIGDFEAAERTKTSGVKRVKQMSTDKSCWTCKYLGNWAGDTFVQDFTCTWFPKHGKGDSKNLWPSKDPDEGCKFGEGRNRKQVSLAGMPVFLHP